MRRVPKADAKGSLFPFGENQGAMITTSCLLKWPTAQSINEKIEETM
jgi:hypothetical protein